MPVVSKANGLLAEFAIFPVEADSQASLVERVTQNIESTLKHHVGLSSGTVLRSRDGLRVTSYVQWANQGSYLATQPFAEFAAPDVHLYEIFAEEPEDCELHLSPHMDGLINFGIFKMKQPENQSRFVELFHQALKMVSGQAGLISTHAIAAWMAGVVSILDIGDRWKSLQPWILIAPFRLFSVKCWTWQITSTRKPYMK